MIYGIWYIRGNYILPCLTKNVSIKDLHYILRSNTLLISFSSLSQLCKIHSCFIYPCSTIFFFINKIEIYIYETKQSVVL